ncbi:hypothetical protein [Streptomyces bungoensis]|uniref:hypothetical protein n=1 Tax=Streptomyces bungoensis TaxID=285568 RepID=UPI003F4D0C63
MLERVLSAAARAPSGPNLRPWRACVLTSPRTTSAGRPSAPSPTAHSAGTPPAAGCGRRPPVPRTRRTRPAPGGGPAVEVTGRLSPLTAGPAKRFPGPPAPCGQFSVGSPCSRTELTIFMIVAVSTSPCTPLAP